MGGEGGGARDKKNDGGRCDIKHIKMFLVSDVGMAMNAKLPLAQGLIYCSARRLFLQAS